MVGTNCSQEWLLEWWWKHYSKHNRYPVVFVNFGMMSEEKKRWCKKRGELLRLPIADIILKTRDEIDPQLVTIWEKSFGSNFWEAREVWFKKPFALLQSPFQTTLWLDLDCEVRGPLDDLFSRVEKHPSQFGMVEDLRIRGFYNVPIYNGGVIAFGRIPLIEKWVEQVFTRNQEFWAEQELISHLIVEEGILIDQMPQIYNAGHVSGGLKNALIYHWCGLDGKRELKQMIRPATSQLCCFDEALRLPRYDS